MSGSQFSIPTPSPANDTILLTRWSVQIDTGADTFSVQELDRLAALTPANDARALAEIADCRAIEVELLGYDPTVTATTSDNDTDNDCGSCHGAGLGLYDGASCRTCGGTGIDFAGPYYDEPDGFDDDALVAYLAGSFQSAVA